MNVLKHGSKVVSVGLMALALSAGFGGLASAHSAYEPMITVTPNPAVLGDNATSSGRDDQGFDVVVVGTHLLGGHPYTITMSSFCGTVVPAGKEIANSNGRVTFVIQGASCQKGQYPVTLDDAITGQPVANATLTVLSPRDDVAEPQTGATTWAAPEASDTAEPRYQSRYDTNDWFTGWLREALS